jgi:hypothetical protein
VFATPDLDGDAANEVAIQLAFGASTTSFAIYRFDPLASVETGALVRLEIAEPGDPWDPTYGLAPGPATFTWYGSVTHQQWLSCAEDPEHLPAPAGVLLGPGGPRGSPQRTGDDVRRGADPGRLIP